MDYKFLLGLLSLGITALAYLIYTRQTVKDDNIQPHPFSWFLWGFVTAVAFLTQQDKMAGPGSWATGLTSAVCILIGTLSFFKRKWIFSLLDWCSLALGLAVFSFYLLTKDPTQAAILATLADALGYYSTVRKAWEEPFSDSVASFTLNSLKFIPAILALESYSIATWLYPATLVLLNGLVALLLIARRDALGMTVKGKANVAAA